LGGVYLSVPKRYRSLALVTSVTALLPVGWFLPSFQDWWEQFQARALHKDASLTGRTYLWDVGHRLTDERPWIGHGTASFWRHGNIDAEGLWRKFEIFNRSGFNFHNIFIEVLVGNGYVGLAILIVMIVLIGFKLIVGFISRPTRDKLFFIGYISAIYAGMRTESALIGPFDFYTIIWLAASVYSTRSPSLQVLDVNVEARNSFDRRSLDAGLAPDKLRGSIGAPG
jgi:exopolysaccharide production protein ExoQ